MTSILVHINDDDGLEARLQADAHAALPDHLKRPAQSSPAFPRARRARSNKPVSLLSVTLLFAACHNLPSADPAAPTSTPQGQAFAQASCGGCHAIGRFGPSSISNAPPFPAIVNQEGLTAETLTSWLRGAHNYPSEMDFYLGDRDIDALVAYMLTLRDPNYRRPPD